MMEQKSSLDQTSSESFFFFNPRTPCGVRQTGGEITWTRCWFQSTHSLRSATGDCASYSSVSSSFNPRTPCGVRLNIESSSDEEEEEVSIHALLAECDQWLLSRGYTPTVSIHALLAECDQWLLSRGYTPTVSIHALLAECDSNFLLLFRRGSGFNPRTPCGVRPIPRSFTPPAKRFQSTHSLRSATRYIEQRDVLRNVSIHALLAECDSQVATASISYLPFQSTHSLRSATTGKALYRCSQPVSIHALLAECDPHEAPSLWWKTVSIHALLAECDGFASSLTHNGDMFQSTHSLRSATNSAIFKKLVTGVSIHALLAECDGYRTCMRG